MAPHARNTSTAKMDTRGSLEPAIQELLVHWKTLCQKHSVDLGGGSTHL